MSEYFIDSSALVKRYRYEVGSERMTALLDSAERLVVARLAQVEVSAAIVRRARETRVAMEELNGVLAALDRDTLESFDVVELDAPVIERAIVLTRRHALRAADALQLACAILAREDTTAAEFIIISSDLELNAAAAAEGMTILDPSQP